MNPIAILISDLHIQTRTPKGRAEPVWLDVLAKYARLLRDLQLQHRCPVLVAGDVFDTWAPNVETINWALDHLPIMYAIPGQHDLPGHNYEGRHRGAYGTLMRAGKLIDLPYGEHDILPGWVVVAVPWGHVVPPPNGVRPTLLMAHVYAARNKATMYHGADARPIQDTVGGYTVALYGDNHIPWDLRHNGTTHFNHGYWVRRSTAEKAYPTGGPGLLYPNGTVKRAVLGVPELWTEDAGPEVPRQTGLEVAARYLKFVTACRTVKMNTIDFLGRLDVASRKAGGTVAGVLSEVRDHCADQRSRM